MSFTTDDLRLWASRQRPTCTHPWEFRTMPKVLGPGRYRFECGLPDCRMLVTVDIRNLDTEVEANAGNDVRNGLEVEGLVHGPDDREKTVPGSTKFNTERNPK